MASRDRVMTIPNVISLLRLAGVPVVVWLLLVPEADFVAFVILVASAISDWADGYLARRLNQVSSLGRLLDPIADRLYIVVLLGCLLLRGIVPWWLVALLVGREVVLAATIPILRRAGYGPLQVSLVGKAATLGLLAGFPGILVAHADAPDWASGITTGCGVLGWAFIGWGTALYWLSAAGYLRQTASLVRRPV